MAKKEINYLSDCLDTILGYNARYNMIISDRSFGKTYGLFKRAIKNWIKNKDEFIYLRRNVTEVDAKHTEHLFDKVATDLDFHSNYLFKVEGSKCYIADVTYCSEEQILNKEYEWNLFGYIIALTQAVTYKSIDFPKVTMIMYEEFLIVESGGRRYLPNEAWLLKDFFTTVARERPDKIKVFLLGNRVSPINPYFSEFNVFPYDERKEYYYNKKTNCLLFYVGESGERHAEKMLESYGEDSSYTDYAFGGSWQHGTGENFIEKKTGNCWYRCTLIVNGNEYGVWYDQVYGTVYISNDVDKNCKEVFALTTKDHRPNAMLIKNANKIYQIKLIKDCYSYGQLRYETQKIKMTMQQWVKWL